MSNDTSHNCDNCGTPVLNGDGYYLHDDDRVCYDCFVALPAKVMTKTTKEYDPNELRFGNCIVFTPEAIRDEVTAMLDNPSVTEFDPALRYALLWARDASDEELEFIGQRAIATDEVWLAFATAVKEEVQFYYSNDRSK